MRGLPEGWQTKPLKDVLQKTGSIDPRKNPDDGFEYIDVSSISRKTFSIEKTSSLKGKEAPCRARRQVRTGDVLFATIRPTLQRIAIVPEVLNGEVCSTGYFVLRPKEEVINNKFLYHFLFTETFMSAMESKQKGASYPAVNNGDVQEQLIPFPPLPEQKRIVTILDKAFAGIDQVIANTDKNLANARDVFESYLNGVFTRKGAGWVDKKVGDICSIKHGFAFKSKFFSNEGEHIVLTPGSFYEKGGFRDRGKKTKYYLGEIPDAFILNKGDFLIAMTEQAAGLLGSSLIVPESNRFLHNQRLGLVQRKDGTVWDNHFFHHQFNTQYFRNSVQETASGLKVRHTSPKKLADISISFPTKLSAQKKVSAQLNKMESETQLLESIYKKKLTALAELKQSILHKAFTGELTQPPKQKRAEVQ
ncbi:MAG: restriction endonuclease subunit S [Candidatus Electrothrix communis]|nr:MAG: restriction endonuclease subunit S [Candidatus Electrothrix communis]